MAVGGDQRRRIRLASTLDAHRSDTFYIKCASALNHRRMRQLCARYSGEEQGNVQLYRVASVLLLRALLQLLANWVWNCTGAIDNLLSVNGTGDKLYGERRGALASPPGKRGSAIVPGAT